MEKLMQYVWQHRLWTQQDMRTTDGRVVQVIDPGRLNTDAGPDFFNAKIKLDGETWAGNVEIHYKASDWFRHHHDQDAAYDSVILHVVDKDDAPIYRKNGQLIPQLRMPCSPEFHERYQHLVGNSHSELPCSEEIATLPQIYISDWLGALAHERLYNKVERINGLLETYHGDWEEVCYITIARCLGFGINGDAFERLAASMPLRFMRKHSDSLLSIEALLFGQSGLLDNVNATGDAYLSSLVTEYQFLANKFSLRRPSALGWKMARMRPANFPHRRIALLAAMIYGGFNMMWRIKQVTTIENAHELFDVRLSGYWSCHYTFGPQSSTSQRAISDASINILLINAVAPLIYAHAMSCKDNDLCDHAITLLQAIPPEKNSIIEMFSRAGIKSQNAFATQALIELRRQYCETHKCLYCRIGHRMLASKVRK